MNNAKEIVDAGWKVLIKDLLRVLPLGYTAVEIYDELQSKQVTRKIQRLEEFYTRLAASVNSVEDKVNQEYINKEDFLDVFEEATRYVVLERHEQKRVFFKNILVNSITSSDCDYDKTERYFRLLDNLGVIELNVLAVLDDPVKYNTIHGMTIKDPFLSAYQTTWEVATSMGVLSQLLDLKIHDVEGAVAVLFSNGLLVEDSMAKKIRTNGNTVQVLKNLLTIRGKDFVKYLDY